MTKPFDPTKPVQLADGTPARIICTDKKGRNPIVALVGWEDNESVFTFCEKGFSGAYRLVNVPEKHVRWVNVYPYVTDGCAHESREDADKCASDNRIACIRIEFEEGEGL